MIANTTQEALAIVRLTLSRAQLNKAGTVIAAMKNGQWYAVAYKGSEGWMPATQAQQAQPLPPALFPPVPPTALEVYCKVRGWAGGTIHGAIADLKTQGETFRDRLLDELLACGDAHGVDLLLAAA